MPPPPPPAATTTTAAEDRIETTLPVLPPLQQLPISQLNIEQPNHHQQGGGMLGKLAAALGGDVVTPGGPLPAGPSALVSHLSDVGLDGDVVDTATSPAMHALAAAQAKVAQNANRLAKATMTGGAAKVAAAAGSRLKNSPENVAPLPGQIPKQGSMDSGADAQLGKRPRRAASGGVHGAVAAATSDWGLDIVSPPAKRSYSVPDAAGVMARGGAGTAAAAQQDRNALLRRALHNGPAPQPTRVAAVDEADAVSALVSMNTRA